MNHLIIYSHPNPASFNHAILETTVQTLEAQGHNVVVRDLYQLNFDPVLKGDDFVSFQSGQTPPDIKKEQQYITNADVITFIYPIWWTGLPALIKGYVDRVFSYGYAYAYGEDGNIERLLQGKKGFMITTHGTPKEVYDAIGMTDSLKQTSDTGIFEFVGIVPVGHLAFGGVPLVDDAARKEMLTEVQQTVASLFK